MVKWYHDSFRCDLAAKLVRLFFGGHRVTLPYVNIEEIYKGSKEQFAFVKDKDFRLSSKCFALGEVSIWVLDFFRPRRAGVMSLSMPRRKEQTVVLVWSHLIALKL